MNTGAENDSVSPAVRRADSEKIAIAAGSKTLRATLEIPSSAKGIVLFGHTSSIAPLTDEVGQFTELMEHWGIGVLHVELLTPDEQYFDQFAGQFPENVSLLAVRLAAAVRWFRRNSVLKDRHLGLFGSGVVGLAAVAAATRLGREVEVVVARNVHLNPVTASLPDVLAPTLLITDESDSEAIRACRESIPFFRCAKTLAVVPAGGRQDELTRVETIARRTARWCYSHWNPPFAPSEVPDADRSLPCFQQLAKSSRRS
jgi:hypothetical protein